MSKLQKKKKPFMPTAGAAGRTNIAGEEDGDAVGGGGHAESDTW